MVDAFEPQDMSTTVLTTIFRDGLQAAADDVNQPLTDFGKGTRPTKSKFVITTMPSRPVHYPHIVVEEGGVPGGRIDRRASKLMKWDYTVILTIRASTNPHIYKIRDGIRAWIQDNYEAIRLAGFTDIVLPGSGRITWDETPLVKEFVINVRGKVYTGEVTP